MKTTEKTTSHHSIRMIFRACRSTAFLIASLIYHTLPSHPNKRLGKKCA